MDRTSGPCTQRQAASWTRRVREKVRHFSCVTRTGIADIMWGDVNREYYRAKQEEQRWMADRDPIKLLTDWITGQKLADQAQLDRIQSEAKSEIDAAVEFAVKATYPGLDQVGEDIYA